MPSPNLLAPKLAPMQLFSALRGHCGQHWESYTRHRFVKQLANGTLPEACFRKYLIQDYLFLKHFARAYALAAYKADGLEDMRAATETLNALIHTEMALHIAYCKGWGLTEPQMANMPEDMATIAYTRYVLDIGHQGDFLDLLVALAPCAIGYGVIATDLMAEDSTKIEGNPYGDWLKTYAGEEYLKVALSAAAQLDRAAFKYCGDPTGGARFANLSQIFCTATQLEAAFWDMGMSAAPKL